MCQRHSAQRICEYYSQYANDCFSAAGRPGNAVRSFCPRHTRYYIRYLSKLIICNCLMNLEVDYI